MQQSFRSRVHQLVEDRPLLVLTIAAVVCASAAAATPNAGSQRSRLATAVEDAVQTVTPAQPGPLALVWDGADIDGDGRADFANPTGHPARGHDAYGAGEFGARRDGGARRHEGVDFRADAGQAVRAPMSGYVTKVGYVYADDPSLKFVEITNPALRHAARVFYVNPKVSEGQTVAIGQPIGTARSLQRKYPGGMTNHVHLELIDRRGRRIDAASVITREYAAAD